MDLWGLFTSACINIALSIVLLFVYSVVRKLPRYERVYFRGRPPHFRSNSHSYVKVVPTWIQEAWQASDEEILDAGGLDAVVFLRMITFSGRIFSIAALICVFLLLPLNYFCKEMTPQQIPSETPQQIPSESLDAFTIRNIREGSKWLWVHCLALYIISCSACILLYFEYENITKMRLEHPDGSSLNTSYFTVIVRAIPSSPEVSCSDSVKNFFTKYHASTYLSHQMVYPSSTVQKLMNDASKMIKSTSTGQLGTYFTSCGLCGGNAHSFKVLSSEPESVRSQNVIADPDFRDKECAAALVFFKTRHAALIASQVLQSSKPMSWVTDLAPEPHDVYWKNLSIPYHHLWIRRIAILLAFIFFMILFIIPMKFVQRLLQLRKLKETFPFLREVLKKKLVVRLITGYLPSVVLMMFQYLVPLVMMLFSSIEGPISRIGRKKIASSKVLYFSIWNVFYVCISSTNMRERLGIVVSPTDMTTQLAETVLSQATFFMTYVLTSGWVGLAYEIMQPYALLCNFFYKYVLRKEDEPSNDTLSFPYHTEISRVLLFGVLGFTYSPMAPLILPLLVVYFFLASLVYRNQILNVYVMKYQGGGQFWPMMHNTTIFSLVLAQVLAIGAFLLKRSPVAAAFTVPLIIGTLVFNEYCRQMFHLVFKDKAADDLMEMDQRDEQSGNMEVIHKQLPLAYCQLASTSNTLRNSVSVNHNEDDVSIHNPEDSNPGSNESWGPSSMEMEELK